MIKACELLSTPVDEALIVQYLQHPMIAKDFAGYYDLYKKYEKDYDAAKIVNGKWQTVTVEKLRDAAFDEKVTMIGLLTSSLNEAFMDACLAEDYTQQLFETLKAFKVKISEASDTEGFDVLSGTVNETGSRLLKDKAAGLLDAWQFKVGRRVVKQLEVFQSQCRASGLKTAEEVFAFVKDSFNDTVSQRQATMDETDEKLHHVFEFLTEAFGESQEMVIFMTELNMDEYALKYIGIHGSKDYFKYNQTLLFGENRKKLLDEIDAMPATWLI